MRWRRQIDVRKMTVGETAVGESPVSRLVKLHLIKIHLEKNLWHLFSLNQMGGFAAQKTYKYTHKIQIKFMQEIFIVLFKASL